MKFSPQRRSVGPESERESASCFFAIDRTESGQHHTSTMRHDPDALTASAHKLAETKQTCHARAVLAMGLLIAAATVAYGEQPERQVVLRSALDKTRALVCEPVYLRLFATNVTTKTVELNGEFYACGQVVIIVNWPNELPQRFSGLQPPSVLPQTSFNLRPDETREILFYDNALCYRIAGDTWEEGPLFDHPTKVVLKVRVEHRVNMQETPFYMPEPFSLEIVEPTREDDKAVLEALLKDKRLTKAMQRANAAQSVIPRFRELLTKWPDSTYAPYLHYTLLGGLTYGAATAGSTSAIIEQLNESLAVTDSFAGAYPDFVYADDIHYRRAYCLDRLGQPREAMNELNALLNKFPMSGRIHERDDLCGRYLFKEKTVSAPPWNLAR